MSKKSFLRISIGYLTPLGSITRSVSSVMDSLGRIGKAAQSARDAMRADHERIQAARQVQLTQEQRQMTPAELFQDSYDRLGWNEEALTRNRTQFRRAKWACMMLACLAFGSGLFMLWTSTHPILAFFVAPTLLIAALIIVSRGALEAWKQAQIELRSVADFKWFMSQPDFFKRLVA
jgi:hypothetical protein